MHDFTFRYDSFLKISFEMQLLHTPPTKFPSQFASPKPNTKKAYMSGCDFCTSKVVEKGNTGLKKQKPKPIPPNLR